MEKGCFSAGHERIEEPLVRTLLEIDGNPHEFKRFSHVQDFTEQVRQHVKEVIVRGGALFRA